MANPGQHHGLILNHTGPRCPHTRAEGTRFLLFAKRVTDVEF